MESNIGSAFRRTNAARRDCLFKRSALLRPMARRDGMTSSLRTNDDFYNGIRCRKGARTGAPLHVPMLNASLQLRKKINSELF